MSAIFNVCARVFVFIVCTDQEAITILDQKVILITT